jgi:hypothetical protein
MIKPITTKARGIHKTHVRNRNLAISGFNCNLGNKSFKEKRDRTDSKDCEVGFNNGLKLNAEPTMPWACRAPQIVSRTSTLGGQVVNLFAMMGGHPCA